ncbi:MAG: nicotinamide-nucleotide adenylyltransferase [Theionarchaea archaeon]|nr:nicotinamide-nucleotide adenylyltransferase [Theionarchaea archaeon]
MRALYAGRFQPFHLGHLKIIKEILTTYDELVIVVGSAQYSHTVDNPFTAGERIQMITESLDEYNISNPVYVIPIDDIHRHSVWVKYVESLTPPFEAVFSNEPVTARLFKEAGYTVNRTELIRRKEWEGTEIRRRMCCNEDWKACIPQAAARIIDQVDGVTRIKELARSDKLK